MFPAVHIAASGNDSVRRLRPPFSHALLIKPIASPYSHIPSEGGKATTIGAPPLLLTYAMGTIDKHRDVSSGLHCSKWTPHACSCVIWISAACQLPSLHPRFAFVKTNNVAKSNMTDRVYISCLQILIWRHEQGSCQGSQTLFVNLEQWILGKSEKILLHFQNKRCRG